MTIREAVMKLFTVVPSQGWTLDGAADSLIQLAAQTRSLSVGMVREFESQSKQFQVIENDQLLQTGDSTPNRMIRPLLAFLANKAAKETGVEFNVYGGRYSFTRPGSRGMVRIDAEFENTMHSQRITFVTTKVPAKRKPSPKKKKVT